MKSYIFLLVSTFLSSYVLGAIQFFMLERLVASHGETGRDWLIQVISAIITIGPVIVYAVSAPLAAAMRKSRVMAASVWLAAIVIVAGGLTGWPGSAWLYLGVIGLALGVYSAGKMASVPLVSVCMGRSTTAANAGMSVVFLLGILTGLPSGTWMYDHVPRCAYIFAAAGLGFSGIFGLLCRFPNERLKTFVAEERRLFSETKGLFRSYVLYLLAGPMLWGVAGAANMAITALVVRKGIAGPQAAAFMALWAAIGVIAGTLVSPWFHRARYKGAACGALLMVLFTPWFPALAVSYLLLALGTVALGVFFGVATNLIDSAYLERVGAQGKEGTGAALQSAMLALCTVVIGGGLGFSLMNNWIPPDAQFVTLAGVTCVPFALATIMMKRFR